MTALDTRYDPDADTLTVAHRLDRVHTAIAAAHDSVLTVLRDADGDIVGVTLHEASMVMVVDWVLAARAHRVPDDIAVGVTDWVRRYSFARAYP